MEEKDNNLARKIAYELATTLIAIIIIIFFMLFVVKRNFAQMPDNASISGVQAPRVGANVPIMEKALGVVFLENQLLDAGVSLSVR